MPIVRKYAVDPALLMSGALLAGQEDARRAAQARQDRINAQPGRWGTGAAAEAHENALAAQLKAQKEQHGIDAAAKVAAQRQEHLDRIELEKQKAIFDAQNDERTKDLETMKQTFETGQGNIASQRKAIDMAVNQLNGTMDILMKNPQNPTNAGLLQEYGKLRKNVQSVALDNARDEKGKLAAIKGLFEQSRIPFGEDDPNVPEPKTPGEEAKERHPTMEIDDGLGGRMNVTMDRDKDTGEPGIGPTAREQLKIASAHKLAREQAAAAAKTADQKREEKDSDEYDKAYKALQTKENQEPTEDQIRQYREQKQRIMAGIPSKAVLRRRALVELRDANPDSAAAIPAETVEAKMREIVGRGGKPATMENVIEMEAEPQPDLAAPPPPEQKAEAPATDDRDKANRDVIEANTKARERLAKAIEGNTALSGKQ